MSAQLGMNREGRNFFFRRPRRLEPIFLFQVTGDRELLRSDQVGEPNRITSAIAP